MRIKASALLVAAAFALPALAQTEAAPRADANTQKLWKIEASGIGG